MSVWLVQLMLMKLFLRRSIKRSYLIADKFYWDMNSKQGNELLL